jgi:hypothetical protein
VHDARVEPGLQPAILRGLASPHHTQFPARPPIRPEHRDWMLKKCRTEITVTRGLGRPGSADKIRA